MKKSLIALLVVLALVVTVSVFSVSAEDTTPVYASDLTVADDGQTATGYCPHCDQDVTWTLYTPASSGHMTMNSGHYFFNHDTAITANGAFRANKGADIVLHLNGKTYKRNGSTGVLMQNGANTKFSIVDGTAGLGTLENVGNGPAISFPDGYKGTTETVTLYSGNLKGDPDVAANGGAIQMLDATATCIFNMYGGTLTGNTTLLGGAIYGAAKDQVNLYGGTVTGTAKEGGAVYLTGTNAKLTVDGGTITGSTASDRGGSVSLRAGAQLVMNDGTIENGYCWGSQMGGNVYAEGNITMSGGTITGGNTTDTANTPSVKGAASTIYGAGRGGNVCIRGAYTMTMTGGTISNGVSPNGGNLSIEGSKTNHSFSGGTISGGEAQLGGNFFIALNAPGGTFSGTTVENGIVYASASGKGRGGNLYNTLGTFNITGGSFTGGEVKGGTSSYVPYGANVYTQKAMTITNATLSGGQATNGFGGNLVVHGGANVTLGAGATVTNGKALRTSTGGVNGQGGNVMVMNGTLTINDGATISNTTGAANAQHAGNIYLQGASSSGKANLVMNGGTVSGGRALSFGGNIYAYTNATVDINGGTITNGYSQGGRGGNLYANGTGTITIDNATIQNGISAEGSNIMLYAAADAATLTNVTISGGQSGSANGGGIYNAGTVTLNNCTISGNIGDTGAGIYNKAGATITMNGGSISGNTVTTTNATVAAGGNVYNAGTFNLVSGTIENGTAQTAYAVEIPDGGQLKDVAVVLAQGGNVYNSGTFAMTTGTISGGVAKRSGDGNNYCYGGNIYNAGTFTMADGTITDGDATTLGGNVFVGGTDAAPATFTMEKGTISEGYSAGNAGGVRVDAYATFTMNGGLIDNNDAVWSGGNISVQGTSAVLDVNGGTISNGDSTSGAAGNLLVSTGATVTVDNATISGGYAKSNGGNVQIEAGTATFNNTDITGGKALALGGNINISAAGSSFTGCEITDGVAGTKVVNDETGEIGTITTGGRGGNIAMSQNTTLTNCVIRNGEAWSNANPGGGNIYYVGGTNQILDGCTITGGISNANGGNINLHGTPTVTVKGDSYIAGGISTNNWGGNIGYTNNATLKLQGNTVVDGAESRCHKGAQYGNNIGINATAAKLYVSENATIKNGDNTFESTDDYKRYSVAVIAATSSATPKIYLAGNSSIDKIYLRGTDSTGLANIVVVQAGFTGTANVYTNSKSYNDTVVPGADVYDAVVSDGYTGTGALKVLNHGQTGYVVIVDNGTLKVCGITGFKVYNKGTDDEYTVENGFATLDAVVDAGMDYAKLYVGGTYDLTAKTDGFPIDMNNQVVTFNTNGYKLAPIDWRTDGAVVAKYTKITVDNDENVLLQTQNPVNDRQYLNIKGDDGKWTSNRVTVELTKVSIKTNKAGVYYTTKIAANANAAPYLVDYGTAVSLVPDVEIGADFLEKLDTNGVLYTAFDLSQTENFSINTRSALISGIVSKEATDPNNDTRAKMDITATSFVTAIVDGKEVKIMADETHVLSFEDIMVKLDDKVEELNTLQPEGYETTIATAVAFYKEWADPFAAWTNLPNLKAEAAKAA